MVQSFNIQGVGIIAASLITFGTRAEGEVGRADPARRDHRGARHERAGRGVRPRVTAHQGRVLGRRRAYFVVNGQKVWTSGAHDADVLLTFVRTDPDAPKHKGISVLLIPTDTPGVVRRPFASAWPSATTSISTRCSSPTFCARREPRRRPQRRLAGGQRLTRPRTKRCCGSVMPTGCGICSRTGSRPPIVGRIRYATLAMDNYALRCSARRRWPEPRAARRTCQALSVLKLLGAEAAQARTERALARVVPDGLIAPGHSTPVVPMNHDRYAGGWARPLPPFLRGAPSQAARRKSSETSSRSACWGCRGADVA